MYYPAKKIKFLLVFIVAGIVLKSLDLLEYMVYGLMAYLARTVINMVIVGIRLLVGQIKSASLEKQYSANQAMLHEKLAKDMQELRKYKDALPKEQQEQVSELEADISNFQSRNKNDNA